MIIYFAELSHTGHGRSPNTVPLAAGYLAAHCKNHHPDSQVIIFRDPHLLLEMVKIKNPDIVSFSIYLWSENLSSYCAKRIKEISKDTVIVVGGSSVDDIDLEVLNFLGSHPWYDVCIPNEGEVSFLYLIEHLKQYGRLNPDTLLDGCARLSSKGYLLRGIYKRPDLKEIPSPYLTGLLDQFLTDGYEPIIQSMRGCPYSCAFCVSGTRNWSRLRAFDLDRVFQEIQYIKQRTKAKYLILADENLGIFKERDVKLAEYIIKSYKEDEYPSRLYFYSAKIINDHVLKIVETLSPIGEFTISFQTLNENTRKEIGRVNNTFDQFLDYVKWAKDRRIISSTEMIFGLPKETKDSYIEGLEQLLCSGVDRIYSYNLRLFNGIDLSTQGSRNKYGFKTMFRLPERTYGCYDGQAITELEEVVVGSNSFNFNDYIYVRMYGLFLELASGRGYLSELIRLLIQRGLDGEKIVKFLTDYSFDSYPKLKAIVEQYINRAKKELFETSEQCKQSVRDLIICGQIVPEVKLNFIFTGKIMFDAKARSEFFNVIKEFINTISDDKITIEFFTDYIDNDLAPRITLFNPKTESEIQDIYMTVSRFGLMRGDELK